MSVSTSQQIARFFNDFSTNEVTFTKDVIRATLLHTKQVFLKILGFQYPCIVYSSSLVGAKVIVNLHDGLRQALAKSNNLCSLRFSFLQRDNSDPISFFVSARINGMTPYGEQKPQLHFLNLQYTQRPPDDLIEVIGSLLEANANAKRRKEERIVITADTLTKLGIASKGSVVIVDGIPRKGLLRDVSFSGAKVIIMGVAKFIVNKPAVLRLELQEPRQTLEIAGEVVRFEGVEGRNDIAAFALKFNEETVPMEYKVRLSSYFRQGRRAPITKQPPPGEPQDPKATAGQ
ncbi:MAG: PilZN3 domain-containing protein [Alkalispirochaetaceae bacterium]